MRVASFLMCTLYCVVIATGCSESGEATNPHFHGARWGMREAEVLGVVGATPTVRALFPIHLKEGEKAIYFADRSVGGIEGVAVAFVFVDDALVSGVYSLSHPNKTIELDRCINFYDLLSTRFGPHREVLGAYMWLTDETAVSFSMDEAIATFTNAKYLGKRGEEQRQRLDERSRDL